MTSLHASQDAGHRLRSAGWLATSRLVTLGLAFPMSVVLARVLGPSGKGTVTVAQVMATVGAAALNLGLGRAFVYYAARRQAHPLDAIRLSLAVSFAATLLLTVLARVAGPQIAQALFQTDRVAFVYLGALGAAPVLLCQLLGGYLVGSNLIRKAAIVTSSSLLLQLAAILILAGTHLLTTLVAVAVWLIAVTGSAAVLLWHTASVKKRGVRTGALRLWIRVFRYSMASWASGGFALLSLRQDMFLVSYFLGTTAVGLYSVAVTLAELSWLVPNALNGVLVPKVASEGRIALDSTLRLTRLSWPLTLATAVVVAAGAWLLLPLVFGLPFEQSWVPLVCLIPGIVAASLSSILSAYVTGLGYPLDWTAASMVNLTVNLILNLLLIPRLGIEGAALASSLSYIAAMLLILRAFIGRSRASLTQTLIPTLEDAAELRMLVGRVRRRGR